MAKATNQDEINFVKGSTKFQKELKSSGILEQVDALKWSDILFRSPRYSSVVKEIKILSKLYQDDLATGESLLKDLQEDFSQIKTMGQALSTTSTSLPYMVTVSSKISALSQSYNIVITNYQNKRNDSLVYLSLFLGAVSIVVGAVGLI
jgi:hypothetical protein